MNGVFDSNKKARGHKSAAITRSRGGCLSCKKLKIKCDQSKPRCEYCTHTNRTCEYQPVKFINTPPNHHQQQLFEVRKPRRIPRVDTINKRFYDDINTQFNLNRATSQLGISKFELRLLDFFNSYCIYAFSSGSNDAIHSVWVNNVPPLFLESRLIQNSVYAYASLNLFPLCEDLNQLRIQDDNESQLKFGKRYGPIVFESGSDHSSLVQNYNDLYTKTTQYFISTISGKNKLIENLKSNRPSDRAKVATELMVASIIIFSFLGTHHHKLIPLVNFDESESDFISICVGIRATIRFFSSTIRLSAFQNLFAFEQSYDIPNVTQSNHAIIVQLRQDLEDEYNNKEKSTNMAQEYTTIYETLESLHISLYKSISVGYPVPLYRWILLLPKHFTELVYAKCPFALRLLHVFACLSLFTNFHVFHDSNIWIEYITWYKSHNYQVYNTWKYNMDKSLYYLAIKKDFKYDDDNYSHLVEFNPEFLEQVI